MSATPSVVNTTAVPTAPIPKRIPSTMLSDSDRQRIYNQIRTSYVWPALLVVQWHLGSEQAAAMIKQVRSCTTLSQPVAQASNDGSAHVDSHKVSA